MKTTRREFIGTCTKCALLGCAGFALPLLADPVEYWDDDEIIDIEQLSYCSADCHYCDAFNATQLDDDSLRIKAAKRWNMKPREIQCHGCKAGPSLFVCEAKKCAIQKGFKICALCDEFPACDKSIWKNFPTLRESSEKLREKLIKKDPI